MNSRLFLLFFLLNLTRINGIINGTITNIMQAPCVVAVLHKETDGSYKLRCGGSLISPQHTLTAAHCVEGLMPDSLLVHGSSAFISKLGQNKSVSAIHIHPDYNSTTRNSDVAVLKVATFEKTVYAKPCEICDKTSVYKVNGTGILYGYGLTSNGGVGSDRMRSVEVTIIGSKACKAAYGTTKAITNRMHCSLGPGINGGCTGDFGGPSINKLNQKICGVFSSMDQTCGTTDKPMVYTALAPDEIRKFINETLLK